MSVDELLVQLAEAGVQLRRSGDQLVVTGEKDRLTPSLVAEIRDQKQALLPIITTMASELSAPGVRLEPGMLPLVELSQDEIDAIVAGVPGGAGNVQDVYPLAPLQEGMLFHHLMAEQGDPYQQSSLTTFDAREHLDAYLAALQAVVARHDILRTAMVWEGLREPVQVVWRHAELAVEEVELDDAGGDAAEQMWRRYDPRRCRMDLRRAPLLRACVAEDRAKDRWLLLLQRHHLTSDHESLVVLNEEISAHLQGRAADLPAPRPFRNYVAQARMRVSREEHEAFFRDMLGDVEEPTAPYGVLDVWGEGQATREAQLRVDRDVGTRLRARARELGVSTASLCHVAWAQVLARLTGREDVVFGTLLFGRMQGGEGSDRVMGPFINTLPVRIEVGGAAVEASIRKTHVLLAELLRHEHASLSLAQRCSGVLAPTPLFTSLLNYRHTGRTRRSPEEQQVWKGIGRVRAEERTNYPVNVAVNDFGEEFSLTAQVVAPAEAERVCRIMHAALEQLVEALEVSPRRAIGRIDVLPAAERRQVVQEWNATEAEYPRDACVHELFERQVERTPEAVAVVYEDQRLSYAELNASANRLAHHLREMGVGPDTRVAICAERSIEMVVGLLAVLKAGGAYVPLDPEYPQERLSYMLQDSAPAVLLAQGPLSGRFDGSELPVVTLNGGASAWADQPQTNPGRGGLTPEHLAYVIYTSGSTGQPKGVMNQHRSVVNLLAWGERIWELGPGDAVLQRMSFSFDVSVRELFSPLLAGARLVLVRSGGHRDLDYMVEVVRRQEISTMYLVPSMMQTLMEHPELDGCSSLRRLGSGGEPLPRTLAQELRERLPDVRLYHEYGPTEATVTSMMRTCIADTAAPGASIGEPISNTSIYLLDSGGEPVPVGVAGELYIGGAGLARGYLNRPELTAERFVPDALGGAPGARLYRTGDLGRWLPDGTVEFLGRVDHQVKVRGFRIELGEIEARLLEHVAVREAAVIPREDAAGAKQLVAYYVGGGAVEVEDLRAHLQERLPEYMVPAAFVHMEEMPLTPSGKVDRKALPAPEGDAYARRGYEAPVGEVEEALAEIWAEVLKVERVGRWDHFFELGGHSLLAIKMIERMRRAGLHTDVRALFTTPVLAELAAEASGESHEVEVPANGIPEGCESIRPEMLPLVELSQDEIDAIVAGVPGGAGNVQDVYPLAPLQEGMLFHHLMAEQGDPYQQSSLTTFDAREHLDAYLAALQAVVARHDILRTAMVWEGLREPVQVVWRHAELAVEEVELDDAGGDAAEQMWRRYDPRRCRMDLRRAPLLRACIAEDRAAGRWLLLLRLHHITGDHESLEVLKEEIAAHLDGRASELPTPLPFRNYVAQARLRISREEHEAFFRDMLGDMEEPTAPYGVLDVWGEGQATREARLRVEPEAGARLRARARALGVSTASLCHLAWAQVLARLTGREDVVFGTLLFGRMQGGEGSDRVMGPFINTLPVRIGVGGEAVEASARKTHGLLTGLLRHEHASLALAQRCSGVPAPTPLFTTLLNYVYSGRSGGLLRVRQPAEGRQGVRGRERTNYPVSLAVDERGEEGFVLRAQVVPPVDPEQVCRMMHAALERLAEALEVSPRRPVGSIDVLPEAERARVVEEWNATDTEYPGDVCVHELFQEQVERTPGAVALVFEGERVTYAELNRQANRLAHHLREMGVGPDALVAVGLERSVDMVVALLAVLKAGGAFVPVDPEYPQERLRYTLEDSAPMAVLTQASQVERFRGLTVPVLDVVGGAAAWAHQPESDPGRRGVSPESLAYVIYTSGSTGTPKGVMVQHRSLCNHLRWYQGEISLSPEDRGIHRWPLSSDAALTGLLGHLLSGASLVLQRHSLSSDPDALVDAMLEHGTTSMGMIPTLLQVLVERSRLADCVHLRTIISGAERLPGALADEVCRRLPVSLYNVYGPTEATIAAASHRCAGASGGETVPIGRPVANTRIYILDTAGEPVPAGVAGELYIGGVQVARGYRARPELTAERFVPDPFGAEAGGRLYRTGDLGRWVPDGLIEFLGRNDAQVKVRGYRIELGEIEARLLEHAGVREAAVVAREDDAGDRRLVAYWVGADAGGVEHLRAHLLERLPEYMVPAAYVHLEEMPLTPNGKLDRRALPAPRGEAFARRGYEAPVGEVEEALAGIWSEVLRVERVGRWDSFFELGGHSLLAVQVVSRVRQRLGVEVPLGEIFRLPVLAEYARRVATARHADLPPIERVDRTAPLPLSFAQQRLWFLEQMGGMGSAYHIPWRLRLRGPLDAGALRQALDRMVARHEVLRTTFRLAEGEPVQRIAPVEESGFRLAEHDLTGEAEAGEELRRLLLRESNTLFDLERGPLVRGCLVRLAEDEHVLLVMMHHIVTDGWSMGVWARELSELYGAYRRGEEDRLPALEIQYADYAAWQRRWVDGEVLREQAEYWRRTLSGAPELLELPTDHPRPPRQDHRGAGLRWVLDEELATGLKGLTQRHGTTLFMTVLAGLAVVLGRLSGQEDLVVGMPTANRGRREIEGLIGFFLNTLALRVDLTGSPTVAELLARVKERVLEAQQNQDIPFEQVVELVQPVRSLAFAPLFQVNFTWQNAPRGKVDLPGVTLARPDPSGASQRAAVKYDLSISLGESGGRIAGGVEYATSLFRPATVERYLTYVRTVLEAMVANDRLRVDQLPLLPEAESGAPAAALRVRPSAEFTPFAADAIEQSIASRFRAQVAAHPRRIAVHAPAREWSYAELDAFAQRVARATVASLGSGPGRVGLLCEPDAPMVASVLGALMAGKTYVPLDPAWPERRMRQVLGDAGATLVLADHANLATARRLGESHGGEPWPGSVLPVESLEPAGATDHGEQVVPIDVPPDQVAYLLYTSGSTGEPKGVAQSHRNVLAHIRVYTNALHIGPEDRLTLLSSYATDAAVMDLFGALLNGAGLHLFDVRRCGVEPLGPWLRSRALTLYHSTPTLYRALLSSDAAAGGDRFPSVRLVVLGGEAVIRSDFELFKQHFAPGCDFVNGLGPTESTLALQYFMDHATELHGETVPAGYAVEGTEVLLLNDFGEPVELYARGEIVIRSPHVALGYWGRPDLTARAFVPDPDGGASRMYRTGDVGRRLPDGTIEFLGRRDRQVKIRGYRVEPDEVAAVLRRHPGVREAAVVARSDGAGAAQPRLVAYVVADPAPSAETLRAHVAAQLPEYMVPAAYVPLAALPLTSSGKLDRNALPVPEEDAYARRDYAEPEGEVEEALAEVWAEVLRVERVGRRDNFFELGGHSLLAVQVISRVRRVLGVEVALSEVFQHPVLADFAHSLQAATRANLPPIQPVDRGARLALSFAQQRLWFLDRMGSGGTAYHIPARMRLLGELDPAALRRALDRIVARHEALRTTFPETGGVPEQRIAPPEDAPFHLVEHDLRGAPDAAQELRRLTAGEVGARFDLARGPLIRGRLVRLADEEHVLLLCMHHIVSDGWSRGVLTRELSTLYGAFRRGEPDPLPPLAVQYADYAVWQRRWVEGEVLQRQTEYWKETLAGAPELLELPMDRPRPAVQDHAGGSLGLELDEALTAGLKALSRRNGTTLFMTVLAGWSVVLGRLSGQEDVVVGTPTANRGRAEIEGLIGFFVNTLALRLDLSGTPTVAELLGRVKERALGAQYHQDLPFEQVVEAVQPVRSLAHTPLFQVMLVWQNTPRSRMELPGLALAPAGRPEQVTAKFDLSLFLSEQGGRIAGGVEYATALFESTTVARHLGYLRRVLEGMVAEEHQTVAGLPLLPEAERRQVLEEWNATSAAYPGEVCVHELFERQVEHTPDAAAVVYEGEGLSYAELNRRANRLAHHLRERGVGPDVRVAICVERSPEMIVGVLAVLKAGGAYVPLDPEYPEERLRYMLHDSAPVAVLTRGRPSGLLGAVAVPTVDLKNDARQWMDRAETNPERGGLTPEHLAYVIYTSGSTGRPKGVMVRHAGLTNYVWYARSRYTDAEAVTFPLHSSLAFDLTVTSIYVPLLTGGSVAVVREQGADRSVPEMIGADGAQVVKLTPAHLTPLAQHDLSGLRLRRMVVGGEELSIHLARAVHERSAGLIELYNEYGPTEATVGCVVHRVSPEREAGASVPIGRPIMNTRVYVLDRAGAPVPVGVVGELYIGGVQVARGYLGRSELTAERFVPDPFSPIAGGRLYRTGDRVRWLADGNLEFLGRNDHQVKVRGFRIELGEIEARLLEHKGVRGAAVVAREDTAGDRRLVAYWLGAEEVEVAHLREHLSERLPEYMVPAAFVRLEEMPLTPNGKLDRRALPAPEGDAYARRGYEVPVGEVEEALAGIWAEVLRVERVGRWDHFFELGGHSLLAVQVIARVRQVLDVDLVLADLFAYPTIESLSARACGAAREIWNDRAVPVRPAGSERPLFLVHEGTGSVAYAQVLHPHIDAEIPLYALPAAPVSEPSLRTVEGMAARLVRMIREVQPAGPYRVAGWSFGGILAYEIAAQLIAQDQVVEFLGMMDSPYPVGGSVGDGGYGYALLLHMLRMEATGERRELEPADRALAASGAGLETFVTECREQGLLPDHVTFAQAREMHERLRIHRRSMGGYRPEPIALPVHLFSARNGADGDPRRGWQALLDETLIRVTPVPGTHLSMMEAPNVESLGRALSGEIRRAIEESARALPGRRRRLPGGELDGMLDSR